jgi:hypothetical protein
MMTPEQQVFCPLLGEYCLFPADVCLLYRCRYLVPLTPDATCNGRVGIVARVRLCCERFVQNNSVVKKGDLLYELDATPFNNRVEAAQTRRRRVLPISNRCADCGSRSEPQDRTAHRAKMTKMF